MIFFVSGKKSSNGKMLFEECLKVNANSHLIDNEKEIDPSLLQNVKSIGVCGATSTPKWLMEKIMGLFGTFGLEIRTGHHFRNEVLLQEYVLASLTAVSKVETFAASSSSEAFLSSCSCKFLMSSS